LTTVNYVLACELADHRVLKRSLESEMSLIRAKPAANSREELDERRRAHEELSRKLEASESWFAGLPDKKQALREYIRERRGPVRRPGVNGAVEGRQR